ncbi:MAG: hypothetical protein CVV64_02410 [Candidatus Wallbacteria bacterium HGW-Wallbacteria-1]|jgi:hypothetical protein|uniref:Uncharacterized protein n=1 Tax=Candidatus Wallbacteria bacterium HGW-Wallbacteria-1 TaxID=2013854 RepID=A0A2N1PVC0_9BACT|nr:MAG: hypothetical protein CVV64_02410 [Candidatus Wallbacteria bacterium HGW-Wallbacteria-1]
MDYVDQSAGDLRLALYRGAIQEGVFTTFASLDIDSSSLPPCLESVKVSIIGESHIIQVNPFSGQQLFPMGGEQSFTEILACFDLSQIHTSAEVLASPVIEDEMVLCHGGQGTVSWTYRSRMTHRKQDSDALAAVVLEFLQRSDAEGGTLRIGHVFPDSPAGFHCSLEDMGREASQLKRPMTVVFLHAQSVCAGDLNGVVDSNNSASVNSGKDNIRGIHWESMHTYPERGEILTTHSEVLFQS